MHQIRKRKCPVCNHQRAIFATILLCMSFLECFCFIQYRIVIFTGTSGVKLEKDSQTHSLKSDKKSKGKIQMQAASGGLRLLELAERKKHEVRNLLQEHHRNDDPLQMRLKYYTDDSQLFVKEALRRAKAPEDIHQLSVICDLKRQSPTGPSAPRVLANFLTAGDIAKQMVSYNADAIMVNTDFSGWAGDLADLTTTAQYVNKYGGGKQEIDGAVGTLQEAAAGGSMQNVLAAQQMLDPSIIPETPKKPTKKVPIIVKDIIIHPIQIALALENGANCIHLCAALVGSGLEDLLDACTIMGTEAMVEVHTPNELDYALELGANLIMVNNWDRLEGTLHRSQALALGRKIPPHIVSIAAGGIFSPDQAFELADIGYDGVVLGRAMSETENIKKLISTIRDRKGLQRQYLGWGLRAEDF